MAEAALLRCVRCKQDATDQNGPVGTYDGQFTLCGPCGELVREVQAVASKALAEEQFKAVCVAFEKKYPTLVIK